MAERIVSPGVFTSEIDQSFLPAAISNLGAALIGTCTKGPAFVPTVVNSFTDFNLRFGNMSPYHYLPYTAQSYLKNATSATVVRVLGDSGYTATKPILIESRTSGPGTAKAAAHAWRAVDKPRSAKSVRNTLLNILFSYELCMAAQVWRPIIPSAFNRRRR